MIDWERIESNLVNTLVIEVGDELQRAKYLECLYIAEQLYAEFRGWA